MSEKRSRLILQDDDVINHHWQDCQDILDHNAARRADPGHPEWVRLEASIPAVIALGWWYEEVRKDPTFPFSGKRWNDFALKKLQDPEWKKFRCQPDGSPNFSGWRKP